jgi:microsomal dipeptidase-like Zn-dependent dipeptidase
VIVDLHAHYPMHVVPGPRGSVGKLVKAADDLNLRDRIRAILINFASRFGNWRNFVSGPRVRVEYMREGEVQVVLSVLYSFWDEVDVAHGAIPRRGYLHTLEAQLQTIEDHIKHKHAGEATVVHDHDELSDAQQARRLALIHCIEGGFHLGPDPDKIDEIVEQLANLGVAYITLAHLIYRDVATDAPALPFLSDEEYAHWFPQPATGLTDIGRAAVRAMVKHGVIVDVAHMSDRARGETFALLDKLDPDRSVPVFASHAGYRFGTQEYMLPPDAIRTIQARHGVIALIFATHQLDDGLPKRRPHLSPRARFAASIDELCRHIDAIHEVTGTHAHTAIGSDFDGFIKPTLPGIEDMRAMRRVEAALRKRYGNADGDLICSGNALRLLEAGWSGRQQTGS